MNRRNKKLIFILIFLLGITIFGLSAKVSTAADASSSAPANSSAEENYMELTGAYSPSTLVSISQSNILLALTGLAAKIITLFAGLTNWAIQFGNNVLVLDIVRIGSQTVLAFANLGFVLAIIVIAFATIFRVQSYAMKQTLWKLIVAALLVNFSLTIAGAFISVSNSFSNIFISKFTGGNLADGLAGILNPQAISASINAPSGWSLLLFNFSGFFKFLISLFFVLIFTLFIMFIFIAIFAMSLIRIIYLSLLLIIMPIVWLAWIFPGTLKYWQEWWNNFLRWTFFAPVMLFFIWLVIATGDNITQLTKETASGQNVKDLADAFQSSLSLGNDFVAYVAKLFVIGGLLFGSLIVANRLSITGAKLAYGKAVKASKSFGGYVGKKGMQFGTGWLRKPRGKPGEEKSYADRISEWSAKSKLTKVPLLGAVPGLAARGVARLSTAGGEDLVKKTKVAASKRSLNENIAMLGYADKPTRTGILSHLREKDLLGKVPNAIKYIDKKYKNEFESFGQGAAYDKIEKSLGINTEMKEALDKKDAAVFDKTAEKFFSKFSKEERKKLPYDVIYGEKPVFGLDEQARKFFVDGFTKATVTVEPGNARNIIMNVNPNDLDRAKLSLDMATSEIERTNPKLAADIKKSRTKSLGKRIIGWEEEGEEEKERGKEEGES